MIMEIRHVLVYKHLSAHLLLRRYSLWVDTRTLWDLSTGDLLRGRKRKFWYLNCTWCPVKAGIYAFFTVVCTLR